MKRDYTDQCFGQEEEQNWKDIMGLEYTLDRDPTIYAASKGLKVIQPLPNQLFIDIDTPEQLAVFTKQYDRFQRTYKGTTSVMTPSPSRKEHHFHIIVTLPFDVTSEMERLLLQAVLGSDIVREYLCWMSIKRGKAAIISCLFEKEEVI